MKIITAYTWSANTKKPVSFGSTDRYYKTSTGKEIGNNTWLFRGDIKWQNLAEFEISNFRHKDKVNIIQFASSDGSEGYTQIMALLENKKQKDVSKFFQIQAYDIDDFIIKKAASGEISLAEKDTLQLKKHSIDISKYFTRAPFPFNLTDSQIQTLENNPYKIIGPRDVFKVSETLKSKISFNKGDMFKILPEIKDDSNTIVLCRNILGYFHDEPNILKDFINTAERVLKQGSLFIIGNLDCEITNVESLLLKDSFIKIMKNVFLKI